MTESLQKKFIGAVVAGDIEQIKSALDAGVDVQLASGYYFNQLITEKKFEIVQELVGHGIDVNWRDPQQFRPHSLQVASTLPEPELRKKFYDLLLSAGADLRIDKCQPLDALARSGSTDVFDLYDRLDPGSEIMAFYIHAHKNIREEVLKQLPFLQSWVDRELLTPLISGYGWQKWMKELTAADLRTDDGFVQKMAVFSPRSDLYVPHIISLGADFNTQKDPPVKIAVLLGKAMLINALVSNGADIYAEGGSALRLSCKIGSPDVRDVLQQQMKKSAASAAEVFSAAFPSGVTPVSLRETLSATGETGLMLAAKAGLLSSRKVSASFLSMTANDLLKTDKHGSSAVTILIARREYDLLFNLKIWAADLPGAEKIWKNLSADEQKQASKNYLELCRHQATSDHQKKLKQLSKKNKFNLRPKPGKP